MDVLYNIMMRIVVISCSRNVSQHDLSRIECPSHTQYNNMYLPTTVYAVYGITYTIRATKIITHIIRLVNYFCSLEFT